MVCMYRDEPVHTSMYGSASARREDAFEFNNNVASDNTQIRPKLWYAGAVTQSLVLAYSACQVQVVEMCRHTFDATKMANVTRAETVKK